jgi:fermentation-respiration switch protein FrsA (DUF1100 family)
MHNRSFFFVLAWLVLIGGCVQTQAPPSLKVTPLKPATFSSLQQHLFTSKPDFDQFRLRGPFPVTEKADYEIRLSPKERISSDLYLSAHGEKAPLAIFMHGYDSSKQDHSYQAMHLATWGVHSLVLQLPARAAWVGNGRVLARVVKFIQTSPEIIDSRIDVSRIILVGHSFGGYSVTVALAEGASASGAILLDPATVDRASPSYLARVRAPVMVLGADEYVSSARNRNYFYRYIKGGVAEVSIKGANHEDGQSPSHFSGTTEEYQVTFISALTGAALSISGGRGFDFAWESFGNGTANDKLFNLRKK